MASILDGHVEEAFFREMALTGIYLREGEFAAILREGHGWGGTAGESGNMRMNFLAVLDAAAEARSERELAHLTASQQELYAIGESQYSICMVCHGGEGQGIAGVGAALERSLRTWLTDQDLRERLREAARLRRSELAGWPEAARAMARVLDL
jgi:mono/diheme cytochrome c family protein